MENGTGRRVAVVILFVKTYVPSHQDAGVHLSRPIACTIFSSASCAATHGELRWFVPRPCLEESDPVDSSKNWKGRSTLLGWLGIGGSVQGAGIDEPSGHRQMPGWMDM